jgi:hypothetical protein
MTMHIRNHVTTILLLTMLSACGNKDESSTAASNTTETNPDPIEVTDCSSVSGIEKIICLAEAFKSQLNATQLAAVQVTYAKTDAQKWSNLPQGLIQGSNKRIGLNFGSMSATQIQYAKALIKEAAGTAANEGWDELQQLLNADDYLAANGGGSSYGAANYYIALLGTPSTSGTFEIQFGGHHTAFANTYTNGALVGGTPSFRGVEPFGTFTQNGQENQPIAQEQSALSAMLNGLSSSELATAKLSSTYSDLIAGPQKDASFPSTAAGIRCSTLTSAQKTLVLQVIATYVDDIDDADASSFMTKYSGELDNTYISYSGTTGLTTRNDYVRIDGPSVWIEYSCQGGIILAGTHPHSIWRDKTTDYGGN